MTLLYLYMILATNENGTPRKQDLSSGGQKKLQTNVRMLRGHNGAITALHCVTKREVWDLVGDREDAGFFISGSTDCSVSVVIFDMELLCTRKGDIHKICANMQVKIWDPSLRGSELRATLKGHTRFSLSLPPLFKFLVWLLTYLNE